MAFARSWRNSWTLDTPEVARESDIPALNAVFSEAFTERYRKDGLVGVRVPQLNTVVWKFAINDAGHGALLWRDAKGGIVAFNMIHQSGVEGWMGPLAVHPDHQGHGIGKAIVTAGVDWLKSRGATVIGLETMPRTMDNIGFYSTLGFTPGPITVTLTLDAIRGRMQAALFTELGHAAKREALAGCRSLLARLRPGYDYTREIEITAEQSLGETMIITRSGEVTGFALCHTVPLVEGRLSEEMRVLKLVSASESQLEDIVAQLCAYARGHAARRVAIRIQGAYPGVYRSLIARGARVRWTDLRMSLCGFEEQTPPEGGVVLSNWEI